MSPALGAIVKLLFGILLFAGLPLLGWGPGDVSGFLEHPARLNYLLLTLLLQVYTVFRFPEAGRSHQGKVTVPGQRLILVLLQVIPLALVILAPWGDRRDILALSGGESLRSLGLALYILGFLVMMRAEAALGKLFSVEVTIQENHRLVTDGLFRYLRHPRYLGIILFTLGISLVFRSGLGLALVAMLTLALLWRIRDEEALLRREFGTEWESYTKKTWRLVPFVF